jgi:hypothetical protein
MSYGRAVGDPSGDRTLIVEKNASGHRLYYVRLLAAAAHVRGDRVTIVLNSAQAGAPEIDVHLNRLAEDIQVLFVEEFDVASVAELARAHGASLTVVPDGDLFAIDLGRVGRWEGGGRLSVLVLREIAQPTRVPGLQLLKTRVRLHFLRRAGRLSGVTVTLLKPITWSGSSAFATATDPVSSVATGDAVSQLRDTWGLDRERYWFGVLGAISARKNLDIIANALTIAPTDRVGLLVAGEVDEETVERVEPALAQLRASGVRTVVVNRLLEDWELDASVLAIDCVVLAHSNEGPSGLFGKAAAAGTRIVAAGAQSLRRDCAALPDISTWVHLETSCLSEALCSAVEAPRPGPVPGLGSDNFAQAML